MTRYEQLLIKAEDLGIKIKEIDFGCDVECGYYHNNKILINSRLSDKQKYIILAEELGHHHRTIGDITDQSKVENRKQEVIARRWGYERLVGVVDLINAHKHGCSNKYELANFLHITEELLEEILHYYQCKYPDYCQIDSYFIFFNNGLTVLEKF